MSGNTGMSITTGTSLFDQDTAVERVGDDRYRATITARWNVGPVPNGGYLLAIAARAIGSAFAGREPRTMTIHFLRPAKPGPLAIEIERIKDGRRFATATAQAVAGRARDRVACSRRSRRPEPCAGPHHVLGAPPGAAPARELEAR